MVAVLQENYNDSLEYVNNMKQLGINEDIASYQARYNEKMIDKSVASKVDLVINKLNLDRFATKEDIYNLDNKIDLIEQRLELKLKNCATKEDICRLDNKIDLVEQKLENKIDKVEQKLENKMFKHTTIIILVVVLTNIPTPIKNLLLNILHIQ